ncbi:MAG: alpha/beta hydrolase [Rubrobacter sp.]|nr:alpha/beta hydrolase [Rubrobacter sp.]
MAKDLGFVHRFIPGEANDQTTLLLLHGTGGDEDNLIPLGRMLRESATLLSPRGKVLEGSACRFFRRLEEGVFDEEDLVNRTHELAEFVEQAVSEYDLDPGRIFAVGFSNGANIAGSLLLLYPSLLAGSVLLRAMVPFEPAEVPDLSGTSVYLAAGRSDEIVPQENTERLAELLQEAGATVELDWQPRGHDLGPDEIKAARDWLAEATAQAG